MVIPAGQYYHGPEFRSYQTREGPTVAVRCEMCGKGPASGSNVSFSYRHTKRRFRPNIQGVTLEVEGQQRRVRVCTRCLRTHYRSA